MFGPLHLIQLCTPMLIRTTNAAIPIIKSAKGRGKGKAMILNIGSTAGEGMIWHVGYAASKVCRRFTSIYFAHLELSSPFPKSLWSPTYRLDTFTNTPICLTLCSYQRTWLTQYLQAAMNTLSETLRREIKGLGIEVITAMPGRSKFTAPRCCVQTFKLLACTLVDNVAIVVCPKSLHASHRTRVYGPWSPQIRSSAGRAADRELTHQVESKPT